ncbi:alkaline phosphatase [Microbulbifer variabilis]|uniref:Alkaline phosphatase n=1 Tax=Microbulbifer variabilis TaxID=266805 RepID=A0ABY4VAW6_9GAMM|nr:alkaline phosphatase [Microbulbifer variabilis]USD21430.1 alkaline phosphatase [Microbulbifer variabilis]
MAKKLARALSAFCLIPLASAVSAASLPDYQTKSEWFTEASDRLEERVSLTREAKTAKNVILFVGDGMGISTLTAARIFEGQRRGEPGEENSLSFEEFPHSALIKTYNTNQQTPDSAGTMTAMMTGVKTRAGMINVDGKGLVADCAASKELGLNSFLEMMESRGKATGIVSTARLTHATPAATYAHSASRKWEHTADEGCTDIATQMVEMNIGDGMEVMLGGGRNYFTPVAEGGLREDERNLTGEWLLRYDGEQNAVYVENGFELSAVDIAKTDKLLGLFTEDHMSYDADRIAKNSEEPSIVEMTTTAIDMLQKDEDGFFLMVESGRVDHAHHSGNAYNALNEAIELSDAVKAALQKVNLEETLILVTADHSHVMNMAGYPTRGNPILGKVIGNDDSGAPNQAVSLAEDNKPYTTLTYTNGRGFAYVDSGENTDADKRDNYDIAAGRHDLTEINTEKPGFHQESLVALGGESHGGEDISLHAIGAGAEKVQGHLEQNAVFHIMTAATDLSLSEE